MTAESRGGLASATDDPLQPRAQRLTAELTLLLVPALAAVTSAGISLCVKAGEGTHLHTTAQEQMAHGLSQPTGQVVLLDGHDPLLLVDAGDEVGGQRLEGERSHAPDLQLVEQSPVARLVQVAQHRPQTNDDG